ncbi:MucBP domain-containing protein, partial [Enterococcus faecalis]|uniref:MucBP domain-containing protein n=3 Tax=Enterococcus faecalis TaxID=1351 RepID=UPI0015D94633
LGILDLPDEKREQYLEKYQDFLDIKPGNIIINYADEAGKKLSESTIYKNGRFGEILNLEPKKIEGFNYVTTGNKLSFKYRLEEQEKTLVYNKITEDNLTQTIEGKDGETIAEVITRGNLGEIDSTNPDTPLPEGDNRWLKVILPTAVVFESDQDKSNITSPKNYQIKNKSGRPIKVDILTYEIMGGNGVAALNTLNIQRSAGYQGTTVIPLVNNGGTKNKYDIQKEFVRLANSQGDYNQMKGTGIKEISFEFTGTADLSKLEEEQNYIESKLTFK